MAQSAGGVLRRGTDRVIAGVCSGLGTYFAVDPVLVRVVFVLLALFHGIGILLYLLLWFLMEPSTGQSQTGLPLGERVRTLGNEIRDDLRTGFAPASSPPEPVHHRGLWLGVILIVLGGYFLLDNLGLLWWMNWGVFWPVLLIAIGAFLLLRRRY